MKFPAVAVFLAAFLAAAACPVFAGMPRVPRSAQSEVPAPRRVDSASMQTMQIASHGALMNALVYVAAGAGPHPAVILLHGFPGNERNLDLAQDMRRAGWDVLYFNYLVMHGLMNYGYHEQAVALAERTQKLLVSDLGTTGGMNECYNPDTGAPEAGGHFVSWDLLGEHIVQEAKTGRDPTALAAF